MEFRLLAGLSRRLEEKPQLSSSQTKRSNSFAGPHRQLSQLPDLLETENTNEQIRGWMKESVVLTLLIFFV